MKFPDGLRICGASSVCCDGTFCTPSVTGLTSCPFFSFSATSGAGGASSSCIFRSSAASSDFNRFSSSSFFHTLPAISCNCGIARSGSSCGGYRVSHRQMPVVVGVLVVTLHHEAVVGKLQPLFEYPLADHLYRETVKLPDSRVLSARHGILGDFLQTLSDDLLIGRELESLLTLNFRVLNSLSIFD